MVTNIYLKDKYELRPCETKKRALLNYSVVFVKLPNPRISEQWNPWNLGVAVPFDNFKRLFSDDNIPAYIGYIGKGSSNFQDFGHQDVPIGYS